MTGKLSGVEEFGKLRSVEETEVGMSRKHVGSLHILL
jgi:hypothetical protein